MSSYVELHAASAFSFLQGASLPEILIDRAVECGHSTLALLDRDGVYGAPRFHKAATAAGIKPVFGAELTLAGGAGGAGRAGGAVGAGRDGGAGRGGTEAAPLVQPFPLPVLCESQLGYRNLCQLITRMKLRSPKGEGALTLDELDGCVGGLVALVGRAAFSAAATCLSSCSGISAARKSRTTKR